MQQGLVQIYYGTGKGKTTAAVGQGIRAVGNNLKVIMIQFLKNDTSGECQILKGMEPKFKVFHFEKARGPIKELRAEDKHELTQEITLALKFSKKVMDTMECDLLILDEVLDAVEQGFVDETYLIELIQMKPEAIELILTGSKLPENLRLQVDTINRIDAEKHPMEETQV